VVADTPIRSGVDRDEGVVEFNELLLPVLDDRVVVDAVVEDDERRGLLALGVDVLSSIESNLRFEESLCASVEGRNALTQLSTSTSDTTMVVAWEGAEARGIRLLQMMDMMPRHGGWHRNEMSTLHRLRPS